MHCQAWSSKRGCVCVNMCKTKVERVYLTRTVPDMILTSLLYVLLKAEEDEVVLTLARNPFKISCRAGRVAYLGSTVQSNPFVRMTLRTTPRLGGYRVHTRKGRSDRGWDIEVEEKIIDECSALKFFSANEEHVNSWCGFADWVARFLLADAGIFCLFVIFRCLHVQLLPNPAGSFWRRYVVKLC